jgi:hypothetical protein
MQWVLDFLYMFWCDLVLQVLSLKMTLIDQCRHSILDNVFKVKPTLYFFSKMTSKLIRRGTVHDIYNILPPSDVPAQQKLARQAATHVSHLQH